MQAWRLCRAAYADLSGQGARLAGGRWNSAGRPAVYLADHPALCILEVRVHLDLPLEFLPADYVLCRIDTRDAAIRTIEAMPADTAHAGDSWLQSGDTALLRVPSILVPHCWNYVLNPAHRGAAEVSVEGTTPYAFDQRLW